MDQKIWLPIITLLVGWFLSEFAQILRRRSGRKEPIRQVLADLLELRHGLIGSQFLIAEMSKHFDLSASAIADLRRMFPTPAERDPTMADRYEKALTELARHDPIHAYRLRGKDVLRLFEKLLTPAIDSGDALAVLAEQTRQGLYQEILPEFDRAVLATAWKAGLLDWLAVRRLLREGPVPEEVRDSMARLLEPLKQLLVAQASLVPTDNAAT